MSKSTLLLAITFILSTKVFCQDYKIGTKYDDGYATIFSTTVISHGSTYLPTNVTRYGLMNSTKKIVLPIQYNSVYTSGEPGIYIVKDTMERSGLYSVPEGKFIVALEYYSIEGYREGLAIVKKELQPYGIAFGAIDTKGNIIIPTDYEFVGDSYEGLLNFKKDGKIGFIDQKNNIIIPAMYSNFSNFSNGLAPVLLAENNKYGYINRNNKVIIAGKYVDADNFYKGYAMVTRKKAESVRGIVSSPAEVALIDASGKELTDFSYSNISIYNDGGLFIVSKKDKLGVIDSTGKIVLPVDYKVVNAAFDNNISFKGVDNKYGLMNAKGKIVMQPEYEYISDLLNDRFVASKNGKKTTFDKKLNIIIPADSSERVILGKNKIVYLSNAKAKIFDKSGKLLKTIVHENINSNSSAMIADEDSLRVNHYATVMLLNLANNTKKIIPETEAGDFNEEGIFIGKKVACNFYDYTGKKLNPEPYYSVVNFTDGICAIQKTSSSTPFLADKNFANIKDLATTFYGPYSEGIAMSINAAKNSIIYLDKKGNQVFSIVGAEAGKCTDGKIWVKTSYNSYFFIDKNGKQIGTKTWYGMGEFNSGLAAVKDYTKWGFISNLGNLAIPAQYDEVSSFTNDVAIVKKNGTYMLINKEGDPIDDKRYEGAGNPLHGYFPVMKNKLVGLVDAKNKTIIDFKYQNILGISEDRTWALKDGKWGLLDGKGTEMGSFVYHSVDYFSNGFAKVIINNQYGLVNKTGKLVVPTEYGSIGTVYKNTVLAVLPEGSMSYSLK